MTCEDRKVVRRQCVRYLLMRPAEVDLFTNWHWCRSNVLCEQPWHWYRIVALHHMTTQWKQEEKDAQNPRPKHKACHWWTNTPHTAASVRCPSASS